MSSDALSFSCPVCGGLVPRKAKACPECGACEKSGWSEERLYDGLDLPFEDEPGAKRNAGRLGGRSGREWFMWLVAVIVLMAFAWLAIRGAW